MEILERVGVAALEVRDLHYQYTDGTVALRGVDFRIEPGECVGLIGPNGAGKTTLLWHLNGLLRAGKGTPKEQGKSGVKVLGMEVGAANLPEIRRRVGLLFQDPNDQLFCPTVFEDVGFGPEQLGFKAEVVREKVTRALAQVSLAGFEKRAPHRLSGGEKRRVCLAGVLACEAEVLVLDEPTSNLDPRSRRELMTVLHQLPQAKLLATHDLELVVELCSRVLVLDEGRIVAMGPTVELLNDETLMLKHGLERPHILQHLHPHRK